MKKIPYVCLYRSYFKELEEFTDEQIGRLVRGLLSYLLTEQEPELGFPERYFWPRLREQHDRDTEHYETVCDNRSKAAEQRRTKRKQLQLTTIDDDCVESISIDAKEKEKENEKEKEIEKEKEKEKECVCIGNTAHEIPTLQDVKDFCEQEGLQVMDPRRFVDYYTMMGWSIKGQPIRDWRAAARLWDTTDRKNKADEPMAVSYGTLL